MTITTEAPDIPAPPVQLTHSAAGIDAAVALLSGPDANLEDVAMLLRRLATADLDAISTSDPAARLQALCAFVAQRLREQFDQETRVAPPAALGELVRESMRPCLAPTCGEDCAPWQANPCSPGCSAEAQRAFGDAVVGA